MYGECIFECGQHGVFENAMDFAHVPFVHTFGNQVRPVRTPLAANALR